MSSLRASNGQSPKTPHPNKCRLMSNCHFGYWPMREWQESELADQTIRLKSWSRLRRMTFLPYGFWPSLESRALAQKILKQFLLRRGWKRPVGSRTSRLPAAVENVRTGTIITTTQKKRLHFTNVSLKRLMRTGSLESRFKPGEISRAPRPADYVRRFSFAASTPLLKSGMRRSTNFWKLWHRLVIKKYSLKFW